jgi:hypothetical protein
MSVPVSASPATCLDLIAFFAMSFEVIFGAAQAVALRATSSAR